jgi:glycyl-tRNA synthetase (class II)
LIEEYYHKRQEEIRWMVNHQELGQMIVSLGIKSPDGNELTAPKRFNQLFATEVGIISGERTQHT